MINPIVFLLDLDGTLQGNVIPQLDERTLIHKLNAKINHGKKARFASSHLIDDFKKGLLRPNVASALQNIKKSNPHVEFYVYTASAHDWAHFLLPILEKAAFGGVFFNRPFFTRNQCDMHTGMKSIAKVRPLVEKDLSRKYKRSVKVQHIYLVDNTRVLHSSESNHLIHCPTYNYTVIPDPIRQFNKQFFETHYDLITRLQLDKRSESAIQAKLLLFSQATSMQQKLRDENAIAIKDVYWSKFADIIDTYSLKDNSSIHTCIKQLKSIKK